VHLKVLGTRGEIQESASRHRKHSGLLIDGELLLDLGEKSYLKYCPHWILLTHLHPDHAYFMRHGHEEDPITEAVIFAPEKCIQGVQILKRKRKLGPYLITPIPTHHSMRVQSQAYLVEKDGVSILYTGDLVWIDKQYHHLFDRVDLIITEGSFLREGGMIRKDQETERVYGHNGIPNLIRLFRPHTDQILLIHFGNWFFQNIKASHEKLSALGKKYNVDILVGHDGQELDL
jgi:ribonuclease BN (tRNA processing enzyme)